MTGYEGDMRHDASILDAEKNAGKAGRSHVYEHVLRYMRHGLMMGIFHPGQIMSLRKMAGDLGTSPMPVREAFSRLVAAHALEETASGSVRVPKLKPEKLADLFAVRAELEGMATQKAAKAVTPALIAKLDSINNRLLQAIDARDILGCLRFNQKFHFTLYHMSASDVLMPLIESLWLRCGPTMYVSLLIPSMPWSAAHHTKLLNALSEGNVVAAKRAIIQDIRTTCKALLDISGPQGVELPGKNIMAGHNIHEHFNPII